MVIKIQPAEIKHTQALAKVHIDSSRAAYAAIYPPRHWGGVNYEARAERFKSALVKGPEETYVALEGETVIGFVVAGPARDEDLPDSVAEIWAIYVAPPWWRRGVGSLLYNFVETLFKQQGFESVVLWVLADNLPARAFYKAAAFSVDGKAKQIERQKKVLEVVRYRKILQTLVA
jgi:ribosomal protein S18 acetylase RimI-like enzyme